ncbi:MAG: peptidylprolyl isomerase [Bacteroidota bacterium]
MFKKILLLNLLLVFTVGLFGQSIKKINRNLKREAPDSFHVVFYTNKGEFEIAVYKSWSPLGATRFYQLVRSKFYTNIYVFRSTSRYIQFGITDHPELNSYMSKKTIQDEKLLQSNLAGRVAFATGGVNDRTVQIFINKIDNKWLDPQGNYQTYTPIGTVVRGLEVVREFYGNYQDTITFKHQDSVMKYGNIYLEKHFPGLDKIKKAKIK